MNWRLWLHGLAAAASSGLGNGLAGIVVGIDMHKLLLMMAVNAAISIGLYLKQSPIPQVRQEWTPEQRAAVQAALKAHAAAAADTQP